jgi:hypothetical protein
MRAMRGIVSPRETVRIVVAVPALVAGADNAPNLAEQPADLREQPLPLKRVGMARAGRSRSSQTASTSSTTSRECEPV